MVADLRIYHVPVLLNEVMDAIRPRAGGRYIDATLGEGGYSEAIVAAHGEALGMDADPAMMPIAAQRLDHFSSLSYTFVQANFSSMASVANSLGFEEVDGIVMDLGLSSRQLQAEARGFTFHGDQPLDMRFDPSQEISAYDLVNDLPEEELADLFRTFGEEDARSARGIARSIVSSRPVRTTKELTEAVTAAIGKRSAARIHPATKVFMSLRIAVNAELQALESALPQALGLLKPGGRLVVVAYHSLEDRIVKQFLQRESKQCICPPRQLVCTCGHEMQVRRLNRSVTTPSLDEIAHNPASRSAKLRAAERVTADSQI
ncbi:MAG: 16S rRNA (cytosine(1402)-N(4))-methyltransferase RsmH [Dehalococcoidia bacterium]|nr:16S rRNA (cytosine(1402)-N(4))-methyltransferase RsmH [Dehalococcoidia bacterium]